ncbi:ROM4 [Babesia microti strain RI]|uniref:Rhomboid-like protease n=1 Tax=Babesia microti (strain RI) TaxID=1133968 RepID=A0A1R4AAL4_BABMR|nr:ROM4 [Babesia microti strain RI]SJK86042.1 ROM4 [Babesia microti strain RI]|eukprot:XP_021338239.1 ROM4 [Babesia microti strain RI]
MNVNKKVDVELVNIINGNDCNSKNDGYDSNEDNWFKGKVERRSPLTPFQLFSLITGETTKSKINRDPKLKNNPIYGKLSFTIASSSMIIISFIFELVYNHNSFNGRCISPIVHPSLISGDVITKKHLPYIVNIGYGACEVNLNDSAHNRAFIGSGTVDDGWPMVNLKKYDGSKSSGRFDSPNARIFETLGGLNSNKIRNYKEYYRLVWSMFLHGSVIHMVFNLCCQIQSLWMIEPDWGFFRTAGLYFVSGIFGNLLSAILDPCGTTVGSSGAMYGLMGALIPYCIEYWKTIPRPFSILIFNCIFIIIGLISGLAGYTDNYAHLGGCIAGILWGFGTIRSVSSFDRCIIVERVLLSPILRWMLTERYKASLRLIVANKYDMGNRRRLAYETQKGIEKGVTKRTLKRIKQRFSAPGSPPCRMRCRETIVRVVSMVTLISIILILSILLLSPEVYETFSPPGQFKLSGWHTCHCGIFITGDNPVLSKYKGMFWCWRDKNIAEKYIKLNG